MIDIDGMRIHFLRYFWLKMTSLTEDLKAEPRVKLAKQMSEGY